MCYQRYQLSRYMRACYAVCMNTYPSDAIGQRRGDKGSGERGVSEGMMMRIAGVVSLVPRRRHRRRRRCCRRGTNGIRGFPRLTRPCCFEGGGVYVDYRICGPESQRWENIVYT